MRAEQPRDGVHAKAAHGQRRFVDVRERLVPPPADAHVRPARVLELPRDACIEHAETSARGEKRGSDGTIARRIERVAARLALRGDGAYANEEREQRVVDWSRPTYLTFSDHFAHDDALNVPLNPA